MQTTAKDFLTIQGKKIYYEMAGQGNVLILVHAGFVDSRMWDAQFDAFARTYRVVRYDMAGFGRSDPLEGPVSQREELNGLVQALGIEKAALVGCSLGGETILDFALDHPEKVTALVPVSAVPSGFEMQGEPPAELMEMFAAVERGDLERIADLQIRLWVDGPYRQPGQVDGQVRASAIASNRIAVANQTWQVSLQPLQPLDPPAAGRLREIHAPTLVIAGALDNAEIVRAAGVMEKEILGARKVIVPESAHVPNMERPEVFNQAVMEFLG